MNNKMNRITATVTGLIFAIILGLIFISPKISPANTNNTVIGVILPLTGGMSPYGESSLNGLKLALKHNGVPNIRFIIEDNHSTAKGTATAYNSLINIKKASAIFTISSMAANTISGINTNEFLLLSTVSERNATLKNPNAFRLNPTATMEAKETVAFLKKTKCKRLAIVYSTNDFGIELKEAMEYFIKKEGISTLTSVGINTSDNNMASIVHKLLRDMPDAVYLATFGQQTVSIVRKLHELKYRGIKCANYAFNSRQTLPAAGHAADDFYVPMIAFDSNTPQTEAQQKFLLDYKTLYGNAPDVFAIQMYDLTSIFLGAITIANGDINDTINTMRQLRDYNGVLGKIHCDNERNFQYPIVVRKIKK